jgi:hypothetical protein
MPIYESEYNDVIAYADIFDGSISGSLSSFSDVDWFTFNNPYPTSLSVNFAVESKGNWSVQIYDQNMQILSGRSIDATLTYTLPAYSVGNYAVRVQTALPSGILYSGGGYTITVDKATYTVKSLASSYDEGSSALFEVTRTGNDNNYSIYYSSSIYLIFSVLSIWTTFSTIISPSGPLSFEESFNANKFAPPYFSSSALKSF